MTTTIRYAIQAGNLLSDSTPTRDAIDRLAQQTADAIAAAYPGAEVECPIEWTSGYRPASYTVLRGVPDEDRETVRERLDAISSETWERWCRNLADSDTEAR